MVGASERVWVALQCVQFRCCLSQCLLLWCKALAVLPSHCLALPSHCLALPSHCIALPCQASALPCLALPSQCHSLHCLAKPVPCLAKPMPCLANALPCQANPMSFESCLAQPVNCNVCSKTLKMPREANGSKQQCHALNTTKGLISVQSWPCEICELHSLSCTKLMAC